MSDSFQVRRQRASSTGDVLDDVGLDEESESQKLSEEHRKVSRSLHLTGAKTLQPVEVIADDQRYLTLPPKQKRRGRPSFKSVKNFMSKIKGPPGNTNSKSSSGNAGPKGGWTPVMQRKDSSQERGKSVQPTQSTESTARPLVTKADHTPPPWGGRTPGTVGIHNHGNTCFMNAVLQCLSNTDWFSKYFITKQYRDDLKGKSFSKKLSGSKCEVTEQLGQLLESLWSFKYESNVSSAFKNVVGKSNNQYKGSDQHDAQEFLLWLLDRVNDDLTVKKKEKTVKAKSLSDEQAAEEVLAINNGCLLHNMFQAVYRSSLKCPHCHKLSNTFETYLCLSLSLPYRTTRPVFVTVVYCDGTIRQEKVGLTLKVYDTVRELREEVGKFAETPDNRLVLCQIAEDGFRNTFGDDQPLTDIHENEMVYAIETLTPPHPHQQGQNQTAQTQVDEEFEASFIQLIVLNTERKTSNRLFFLPLALRVPREIDYKGLQREILKAMGHCVREGLLQQKLDILFHLRIVDSCPARSYLKEDPDIMPFYTQTVESALSLYGVEYGPQHLKLVAEWDSTKKERVISHNFDEVVENPSVKQARQSQHQPFRVSLEHCIHLFTKEETLSGTDAWQCSHCHKQQHGATKSLGLWSLPDILVIHLKRFRQTGLRRTKLSTLVDFPIDSLDMSSHVVKPPSEDCNSEGESEMLYDLYGVCNHYGNMLGGHYTAFCRNPLDQRWYEFDDTKVKPMSAAEVKTSSAYLLFYQRRGVGETIREDVMSGSHWIYKFYPLKELPPPPPPQASVPEPSKESVPDMAHRQLKDERPRERSTEKETDFDDFVPPSVRKEAHVPQLEKTSNSAYGGQMTGQLDGPSVPRPSTQQKAGQYTEQKPVESNSPSHSAVRDVQRLSLYDRQIQQDSVANRKNDEGMGPRKSNTLKNRSDSKLTDRARDGGVKNEVRASYGSGLKVKLPENDAFIVRQNNITGQTVVQRYDASAYQEGARTNAFQSDGVANKESLVNKNQNSAITVQKSDTSAGISGRLSQGMYRENNPRLYADGEDMIDSGPKLKPKDFRSSFRGDVVSSSHTESKSNVPRPSSGPLLTQTRVPSVPVSNTSSKTVTPQLQRKPETPQVPAITRQLSHPTRPGFQSEVTSQALAVKVHHGATPMPSNREEVNGLPPPPRQHSIGNGKHGFRSSDDASALPPKPQSIHHKRSKSQPRSIETEQQNYYNDVKNTSYSNGVASESQKEFSKFATIARVNRGRHLQEEFPPNHHQNLPRSSTDNSIRESQMKGNPQVTDMPYSLEARSRKPVYDAVINSDSNSYTEAFPSYLLNRHITKQFQNKDQIKFFRKEKMYSPCLKESSV